MQKPTSSSSSPPPVALSPSVSRAFILAKLSIALLETLFQIYYVDVFLTCYRLTTAWFFLGQLCYLVWNAVNDPLFAWMQDRGGGGGGGGSKKDALKWGGPLLGASFLLVFFPLFHSYGETAVGLHFIFTLCFFDGCFTYTCLAHCALFAEITQDSGERLRVLRQGELAMLGVAPVVLAAGWIFDREDLRMMQGFAVLLAVSASAALVYASHHVKTISDRTSSNSGCDDRGCKNPHSVNATLLQHPSSSVDASPSLWTFLLQFLRDRSMLLFVCLNFLQIGTLAFFNNFFTVILEAVLVGHMRMDGGEQVAREWMGVVLGVSQVLPPVFITMLSQASSSPTSSVDASDRSYIVIKHLTWLKIGMSCGMLLIGPATGASTAATVIFLIYLFLTRALASTIFSFFNLTLSDLIDADQLTYRRARPMSSTYFGWNALVTKPAASLVPVMVVAEWTKYGFRESGTAGAAAAVSDGGPSTAAVSHSNPILSATNASDLQYVVFLMCTLGPLLTGCAQALLWRAYSLHGERLRRVKEQLLVLQGQLDEESTALRSREEDAVELGGLSREQLRADLPEDVLAVDKMK